MRLPSTLPILLVIVHLLWPGPWSGGPLVDSRGGRAPPVAPEVVEGGRLSSRRLVVVLHGGSWRPRTPRDLAERAVEPLDDAARELGLRLLAPVAPESWFGRTTPHAVVADARPVPDAPPDPTHFAGDAATVWATPEGEARVLELVEREVARRRADPRRVYLAGHGAGATAAVHLAARHPDRFAAVAMWSGTPSPVWAPPADGGSRPRVVGLAEEPVPRLAEVPVYLWTGAQDDVLDRATLRRFVERMRDHATRGLGHELRWVEEPGGHDLGPGGPREGLAFLKAKRKPKRR